jgi:hypothetical protein
VCFVFLLAMLCFVNLQQQTVASRGSMQQIVISVPEGGIPHPPKRAYALGAGIGSRLRGLWWLQRPGMGGGVEGGRGDRLSAEE